MQRTKERKSVVYDQSEEPLVVSKITMNVLLQCPRPAEAIALYIFYYYTAKWQDTRLIKCTTNYAANGLGWGEGKVKEIKKILVDLGLIKSIVKKGENGKVVSHYIQVYYTFKPEVENQKSISPPVVRSAINTLKIINLNTPKELKKENSKRKISLDLNLENYPFFKGRFARIWKKDYIPMRIRKGGSMKENYLIKVLNKIKEYSNNDYNKALEILIKSVDSAWIDVYPLKNQNNNSAKFNPGGTAHSGLDKPFKVPSKVINADDPNFQENFIKAYGK